MDNNCSFEEDMRRGYLSTGEALEAAYGAGWWSQQPEEPDPLPPVTQCRRCGDHA